MSTSMIHTSVNLRTRPGVDGVHEGTSFVATPIATESGSIPLVLVFTILWNPLFGEVGDLDLIVLADWQAEVGNVVRREHVPRLIKTLHVIAPSFVVIVGLVERWEAADAEIVARERVEGVDGGHVDFMTGIQ